MVRSIALTIAGLVGAAGCAVEAPVAIDSEQHGLTGEARRPRSEAIRDVAAGEGLTNGALLAGIAQVETGLSHCWSEATWACQGPRSPSCDGPVIAGAADGPCSIQQGGLGMFQFDGGTFSQTLARDGEAILLLEGNIAHAVAFVAERVRQDIAGVDTIPDAIAWLNAVPIEAGDPTFERWIELVSCRYNGCCGCSGQEAKYRDATLAAVAEFEPGFWDVSEDPGDPDPGDPADPADPPADDPGAGEPTPMIAGGVAGCRAAGGATGTPWLAMLAACALAVRRRRFR